MTFNTLLSSLETQARVLISYQWNWVGDKENQTCKKYYNNQATIHVNNSLISVLIKVTDGLGISSGFKINESKLC